jgi:hypothetical protein
MSDTVWGCPLCGQVVEVRSGQTILPPDYFETCRLPERMIGNECIAFRDLDTARRLLTG